MVSKLNFRKWLFLFFTTSILGGISILPAYMLLGWEEVPGGNLPGDMFSMPVIIFIMGLGVLFSIISQMGFFAYLTVHRFGLGLFKSHQLWNKVQMLLILFTFFDLIYFRYVSFKIEGETWLDYVLLPAILLLIALIVAFMKAKQTKGFVFVPAVFFIFVVTTLEIVPTLTINDTNWLILMLVPVLICNIWQLLILHRLNTSS